MDKKQEILSSQTSKYYDKKQRDLNYLLGERGIFHHHCGICSPDSTFPPMSEKGLLRELHKQEDRLTAKAIKQLRGINNQTHILDAGCGRGGSAFTLNQKYKCFVDGVTISNYQVEFASRIARQKRVSDKVKFYQHDMLHTSFRSSSYDIIWAVGSTEHIINLDNLFKEFSRLIKKNGQLLIATWCSQVAPQSDTKKHLNRIDKHYKTKVSACIKYQKLPGQHGWRLKEYINLTPQTIPYWKLRKKSLHRTGIEDAFINIYEKGGMKFALYLYNIDK